MKKIFLSLVFIMLSMTTVFGYESDVDQEEDLLLDMQVEGDTVEWITVASEPLEIKIAIPEYNQELSLDAERDYSIENMYNRISIENKSDEFYENFNYTLSFNKEAEEYMESHLKYWTFPEPVWTLVPVGYDVVSEQPYHDTTLTNGFVYTWTTPLVEDGTKFMKENLSQINLFFEWDGGMQEISVPIETNTEDEYESNSVELRCFVVEIFSESLLVADVNDLSDLYSISKLRDCEIGDYLKVSTNGMVQETYPAQIGIYGYEVIQTEKAPEIMINEALENYHNNI